ncbi:MAG: PQQ-binding-like beta-propeller repeat protein, partial [Pirellulales bacterium]|nr:PQQ-binding-like beta-propeller repeat protein [Pirellulales bacterium]
MASAHREDRSRRGGARRFRPIAVGGALGLVLALAASASVAARAGDWPTYRHDIARSGVTSEEVRPPLRECWVFQPAHAPEPAWGRPSPRPVGGWYGATELPRAHFDDAFHVAVAGGTVYFGSSADGKVYALDAATGKERWSARTGGPVRLAPAVWRDKVYVGSDDGCVYCLRA